MAARRPAKKQARRNGGGGVPGWIWLGVGLLAGLAIAGVLFFRGGGSVDSLLPKPNPDARAPAEPEAPVAQDAPAPRKPKYDFYTVLPEKEVVIPDAELAAQAQAEADARAEAARAAAALADGGVAPSDLPAQAQVPAAADTERFLIQAGAFRSSTDADALKAKIALTGEIARVESAQINGDTIYRVRLGPYPNASALASAKQALGNHGIEAVAIRAR